MARLIGPYQDRASEWAVECFGKADAMNRQMRIFRFLEEALELAQAGGCSKDEAARVLEYVFGRPIGAINQEVGGTMVSLAVLCEAFGLDMEGCAEAEYTRILANVEKIRARHAAKPLFADSAQRCRCGAFEWGPNTTRITDSNGQEHYLEACAGFPSPTPAPTEKP